MIQELKIRNFLSFRDEVNFSFEATKDKSFEDYQIVEVAPKVRLLRFAIIFGPNASGKSNVLKSFEFLKDFWFENHDTVDESTGIIPFLLDKDTPNKPAHFELKFWVDGVKYWYILTVNREYIECEALYYYKSVQPTKLFERIYEDGKSEIKVNGNVVKISDLALQELNLKCLPNTSFFVARNKVNISLPLIDAARNWMRNKMLPYISPQTDLFEYAGRQIFDNAELKGYLLDFIHKADFNISELVSDKIEEKVPAQLAKMLLEDEIDVPTDLKEHLRSKGTLPRLKTQFQHSVKNIRGDETYLLPNSLQSEGTRRTIGIEAAIFEAMQQNAFLSIDEIESSLHPDLVEYVIEQFLKNHNESQLLVTTHYDPLLNTVDDLVRKDSVWFTEKDESGNTSLYSLVDFRGLNKLSSYQKSYRNGRFGALPNIK